MIISPPFLPAAEANESDSDYVRRAMKGDAPGNGAYPVSSGLGWHGGLHLEAPADGQTGRLPVRAIADGTVKYVRKPRAMPADSQADDPLNYHGGWTDNGVVVIEHKTDIGEGTDASGIVFYSIYLHLHSIADALPAAGKAIWRKDEIGQAGYIYGQPNWIHFEIICDDANLKKLVNRNTGPLATSADGRTDSVWGEIYVRLPTGAEVQSTDPQAAPPKNAPAPAPAATATQTTEDYFVGIRYDRGHCITTTYKEDGSTVGTALDDAAYEYGLYTIATQRFKACPSAGYELLRFGRVLGPDALNPADAPHWRKINTKEGQGFVNLNATGLQKFSDADFPYWRNWFLIDDDTTPDDSRCDSDLISKLMLDDGEQFLDRNQLISRLSSAATEKALSRTICKFPSEWDKDTVATRWGWLKDEKKATDAGLTPMTDVDFTALTQHVEALCFWSEAGLTAMPTPWHFEPREFIGAFKQCGWLSQNELIQLFPKTAMRPSKKQWVSEPVNPAMGNITNNINALNKMSRKFGISSPFRIAGFYANALVETGWMRLLIEGPNDQRYLPWQGRGFMQLTWPDNYIKYWRFLGRTVSNEIEKKLSEAHRKADSSRDSSFLDDNNVGLPSEMKDWRNDTSSSPDSADSAGAYWAWSGSANFADAASVFVRETKLINGKSISYYTHSSFGQVAATVNVGHASTNYSIVNGIVARFQAFSSAVMTLVDVPQFPDESGVMQSKPDSYVARRP